jgi:DNA-binding CsgD family transcriptional regulator
MTPKNETQKMSLKIFGESFLATRELPKKDIRSEKLMPQLTPRERQILWQLWDSTPLKVAAWNLQISEGTFKTCLQTLYIKLNVPGDKCRASWLMRWMFEHREDWQ